MPATPSPPLHPHGCYPPSPAHHYNGWYPTESFFLINNVQSRTPLWWNLPRRHPLIWPPSVPTHPDPGQCWSRVFSWSDHWSIHKLSSRNSIIVLHLCPAGLFLNILHFSVTGHPPLAWCNPVFLIHFGIFKWILSLAPAPTPAPASSFLFLKQIWKNLKLERWNHLEQC